MQNIVLFEHNFTFGNPYDQIRTITSRRQTSPNLTLRGYFSVLVSILQSVSHDNVNSQTNHFEDSMICIFAGFCQIFFFKCNDN